MCGRGTGVLVVVLWKCKIEWIMGNKNVIKRLILVVVLILTCWAFWAVYQYRFRNWNDQVRKAFSDVIEEELHERGGIEVEFYGTTEIPSSEDKVPERVAVTIDKGRREYLIPLYKYNHSIVKETTKRMLCSFIIEESPLIADSLNMRWSELMKKSGNLENTAVRISIADYEENVSVTSSHNYSFFTPSDSLMSYYIGYRCEAEVTGFVQCCWWHILGTFWCSIFILFLFIVILVYVFCKKIKAVLDDYFIRKKIVEKEILVPIPVISVEKEKECIYQLGSNCFYDANTHIFRNGSGEVVLTKLHSILMKAFLDAEEHRLTLSEIDKILWNGMGTNGRVHKIVGRLRLSLSGISNITIENVSHAYQLKIPHFIEDIPGGDNK